MVAHDVLMRLLVMADTCLLAQLDWSMVTLTHGRCWQSWQHIHSLGGEPVWTVIYWEARLSLPPGQHTPSEVHSAVHSAYADTTCCS